MANNHPASRIPVSARKPKTPAAKSQARKANVPTTEKRAPLTELEKLDSLRTKLELSIDEFIRARKELEELLPEEGSSEQGCSLAASNVDLRFELQRHRKLTSSLTDSNGPGAPTQGPVKTGSS